MPIGPWELVIILVIVVIIFGAGRLGQIGGAFGKSVREFRSAVQDDTHAPVAPEAATPLPTPAPPVICGVCQTANPATNKFCAACGAAFSASPVPVSAPPTGDNICPSCATVNPPDQAFCGQCGTRLSRAA